MKLWQKIFLSSLFLIIAAVNIISITLLSNNHKLLIEREKEHAISEYEYFTLTLSNTVIYERMTSNKLMLSDTEIAAVMDRILKRGSENAMGSTVNAYTPAGRAAGTEAAVYNLANKQLISSSGMSGLYELDDFNSYISYLLGLDAGYQRENFLTHTFTCDDGRHLMAVSSVISFEGKDCLVIAAADVTDIYALRDRQTRFVRHVSIISAALISFLLLATTIILLRPLSRLNTYTKAIAEGNYKLRIRKKGSQEFRELAGNMNIMAESVQQNAARLEKVAEDRQIFIANLAHEMKTPLTSILGFADLLRIKKTVSDRERAEYAGTIVEETKRLRSLSGKLMELISIGCTETEKKPVSLPEMIRETETALSPILTKTSVSLNCMSEDITISADEELFKSLLYNIIENAVKASGNGQQIDLVAAMYGGNAVISVTDHGIGMSEEDAEKVFAPFYMVDKSRSRKAGGAGLGLALCVRIAELHNAKLSIDSKLGEGTTVYITINGEECL